MKYSGISNLVRKFLLALCLGLAPLAVSATAIIDNGIYSTDDDTGLDWLDLIETAGMSFNEVSAELGPGGDFEGWYYASPDQVNTLINNFFGTSGLYYDVGWKDQYFYTVVFEITALLGDLSGSYGSLGISVNNSPVLSQDDIWISALEYNQTQGYIRLNEVSIPLTLDYQNTDTGSFLIRGTGGQNLVLGSPPSPPSGSVPGPATFPLLLLGLAVLALQRRRRGLATA